MSSDREGITWGPMSLLDLPNPNSGTDAITLRNGWHVLVYNNSSLLRTPLSVAVSHDGFHWSHQLDLETDSGEYSYPSLIEAKDGTVHIVYTWRRERIRHALLRVSP